MTTSNASALVSPDAPLSPFHIKIARKELHEKADHVDAHITSLRRWVDSMPHLTCPDDKRLYLAFLRQAKYNHSHAQARMDNLATLRTSSAAPSSIWFNRPPKTHPSVQNYIGMGIHNPIGFLEDGTFLMLIRMGNWNSTVLPLDDFLKLATVYIDRLVEDPRIQICGLRVMFDMTGISSSHITDLNPRKMGKEVTKLFQEGYPIRLKSFIYYNEPTIMDLFLKVMTHWMKSKIRERIIRCKDDIGRACKKIPGLQEVLPREYGGGNRSLEEIRSEQTKAFLEAYDKPRIWDGMKVDESKRPDSAKNFMRKYEDYTEHSMGTAGTYIKLDVQD